MRSKSLCSNPYNHETIRPPNWKKPEWEGVKENMLGQGVTLACSPSLVPFVRGVVVPKSFANELLITTSMPGPWENARIEIDIDYHATEVE